MGVRGLQSFLKENRQSLSRTVILDADRAAERPSVPAVIDAWGVIYQLYLDSLPWTSGGEYHRFYCLTRRLIEAWRRVGLEPYFVFDGASPPEKHATLLERMQTQVSTARMFYTISPATRSAPSFSRGNNVILPPFTMQAFARALRALNVHTRFVPRGEADGVCVVMAEQLGGFVLGKDTDFIILAANADPDRLKGYAPLDMIEWIEGEVEHSYEANGGSDGSFTTVVSKTRQTRGSRLLPPASLRNPTLVLVTYSSTALCRRLRLPANMLSLLSSLVGNDYTPSQATEIFGLGVGGKPAERIDRVASVLRDQLNRPAAAGTDHAHAAAELVGRVVRKLCTRAHIDPHFLDQFVDAIIEATIQYALPSRHDCCSVYPFCGDLDESGCYTSMSRMSTPLATPPAPNEAVAAYAAAQHAGLLGNMTHAWLFPDRLYLWTVLEDPSSRCARGSPAAAKARATAYAIADEALGGLRYPVPSEEDIETLKQDHEACKLLGVPTSNGDHVSNGNGVDTEDDSEELLAEPVREVVEYLRQGSSNRIITHRVPIPATSTLSDGSTPACLRPLSDRLGIYLDTLGSRTAAIEALPARLQPLAAALRLCILDMASAGPKRWRRNEVEAFVRAGVGSLAGWDAIDDEAHQPCETHDLGYPLLTNRNAELVAQFSAALLDASFLAQALLLGPDASAKYRLTHLMPYAFVSGTAIHCLLGGNDPTPGTGWRWTSGARDRAKDVLAAVLADLPPSAVLDPPHAKPTPQSPPSPKKKKKGKSKPVKPAVMGSRFDLLLDEAA